MHAWSRKSRPCTAALRRARAVMTLLIPADACSGHLGPAAYEPAAARRWRDTFARSVGRGRGLRARLADLRRTSSPYTDCRVRRRRCCCADPAATTASRRASTPRSRSRSRCRPTCSSSPSSVCASARVMATATRPSASTASRPRHCSQVRLVAPEHRCETVDARRARSHVLAGLTHRRRLPPPAASRLAGPAVSVLEPLLALANPCGLVAEAADRTSQISSRTARVINCAYRLSLALWVCVTLG